MRIGQIGLNCTTEIGLGTSFPTASSIQGGLLSGNVCIKGDFVIDVPFSFDNATVLVSASKKITVLSPSTRLDVINSELFSCDGLWLGILLLGDNSSINMLGSRVENARRAVSSAVNSTLFFENNTFNKNLTGIYIESAKPKIITLNGNKFECTSPIKMGDLSVVSNHGIHMRSAMLVVNPASVNTFIGLQFGILCVGTGTVIKTSALAMQDIYHDGIRMENTNLDLSQSYFENCGRHAIFADRVSNLILLWVSVNIDANVREQGQWHYGIFISQFANGIVTTVDVQSCSFVANLLQKSRRVVGIRIENQFNNSSGSIKIHSNCGFFINTDSAVAIQANGIPSSYSLLIQNSRIWVGGLSFLGLSRGILVSGTTNNLRIEGNDFSSSLSIPTSLTYGHWDIGISLSSNMGGLNNVIKGNTFHGNAETFLKRGITIWRFNNLTVCDNTFSGVGYNTICVDVEGTCMNTHFVDNKFNFGGAGSTSLVFRSGTTLEKQINHGNKWRGYNNIIFPQASHVFWEGSAAPLGWFVVHEPISTCDAPGPGCFFTEFHPLRIFPSSVFLFQSGGQPASCPILIVNNPPYTEVDNQIASQNMSPFGDEPIQIWEREAYLYRKLASMNQLHPSPYSDFASSKKNTSVGALYLVDKLVQDAYTLPANSTSISSAFSTALDGYTLQIQFLDSLIVSEGPQSSLVAQKLVLLESLANLIKNFEDWRATLPSVNTTILEEALAINNEIFATTIFDERWKQLNKIKLTSVLFQSGNLTIAQVEELKTIIQEESETGNLHFAQLAISLLPPCVQGEYDLNKINPELGIQERTNESTFKLSSFSVWPNPVSTHLTISTESGCLGNYRLIDYTGKVIQSGELDGSGQHELSLACPDGLYVLKYTSKCGFSKFTKIIVQRP